MARVVVEDEDWFHAVKLVGLRQLGFELAQILQELRPFSLRAQLHVVVAIPSTQRQPDGAVNGCIMAFMCPCMQIGVTRRRPRALECRERVATAR